MTLRFLILSFIALITFKSLKGQTKEDAARWLKMLHAPYNDSVLATSKIWDEWTANQDSTYITNAIQLLDKEAGASPHRFIQGKTDLLKAVAAHRFWKPYEQYNCDEWCKKAIQKASEMEDEHLLMSACFTNASYHFEGGNPEKGLFYSLKAIELAEKLNYNKKFLAANKLYLSSYLYGTRNYDRCLAYCRDIISSSAISSLHPDAIGLYNNAALCFRATGQYDSALHYFDKMIQIASQQNSGVWKGIAAGNKGDVLKLMGRSDEAFPLWQQDIDSCLKYNEPDNAGLTMAFMAEYLSSKGENAKAATLINRALQLNDRLMEKILIYKIKSGVLEKSGSYDSALYFLRLHQHLNDSVNTFFSRTNYEQMKMRLDFENNLNRYNLVLKEKKAEKIRLRFLMGALVTVLLGGWLFISRQRLKYKLALQQKQLAEAEAIAAKDQLELFTKTLLDKNGQIEQLTGRISKMQEQQSDELIHQTILTDDDWNNFRLLFEKAHPGFLEKLKQKSPDISPAEIRLSALIRLGLDNKQMASMQGISISSLRGNKTRLRQRLGIASDNASPDNLEIFIKSL